MIPIDQINLFLSWFYRLNVDTFDIHIRKPKGVKEDYNTGNWVWIINNENIRADYIRTKLLPLIKYENANGSDIYFRPSKNDKHCVIFLDDVPIDNDHKVAKKYTACVVETSSKNTQIWLATSKRFHKNDRKSAQIFLKEKGYTDPGSISGDHLGRLCGLKSLKHKTRVNLIKTSVVKPYCPVIDQSWTQFSPPLRTMIFLIPKIRKDLPKFLIRIGGGRVFHKYQGGIVL